MFISRKQICLLLIVLFVVPACITPPPPPPSTVKIVAVQPGQWVTGEAIWYGEMYHGRRTDSGDRFDMHLMTGSHSTIPFGANVEVLNPANGKSLEIVINDRSHLDSGIDLAISKAAAEELDLAGKRRFQIEYRWVE